MSEVKIYENSQSQSLSVTLTDAAIQHIKQYMAKKTDCQGIEFTLEKTGCSGYAYVINLLDSIPEQHLSCQVADITIYIPLTYIDAFQGVEVDYVKEGLNEKFVFNNPNESGRCGCGESISI